MWARPGVRRCSAISHNFPCKTRSHFENVSKRLTLDSISQDSRHPCYLLRITCLTPLSVAHFDDSASSLMRREITRSQTLCEC